VYIRADTITRLLVCPACRQGAEAHALAVREAVERGGEVLHGVLGCTGCGRLYPVLDGIPVVVRDARAYFESEVVAAFAREDLPEAVAGLVAAALPDEAPVNRDRELVSSYCDAHYGEMIAKRGAEPGEERPQPRGLNELIARLPQDPPRSRPGSAGRRAEAAGPEHTDDGPALDLGCGAGRAALELGLRTRHALGVDLSFALLRKARAALAGEVKFPLRRSGRVYREVRADTSRLRGSRAEFVAADALDPPFRAETFALVVAWNVFDSVRVPLMLLGQADALLRPGGELHLASPYAWRSSVTEEGEAPGALSDHAPLGGDGASAVRKLLAGAPPLQLQYSVVSDEDSVPWTLRRDARTHQVHRAHYVIAKKG
jgi:SAM-dependent methyltransferase/uncharacterized protein YbaR (Trm112 family)